MSDRMDLDAYLGRIGYDGPREPTLDCLRALHRLHPAAIAFENLDPLLGRPPRLDLDSLQAKLVTGGRGGYCYEHNGLFQAVLEALGFAITGFAARVLWGSPPDAPPRQRSHMLLRIDLDDGPYIADVGFGGMVLTAPLRLAADRVQQTPHEPHRLLGGAGGYELQVRLDHGWRPLYSFTTEPQLAPDYEVLNWFSATHPSSLFTANLIAARTTARGRISLLNARFTERPDGAAPRERTLRSLDDLETVLVEAFGVTPPPLGPLAGRLGF